MMSTEDGIAQYPFLSRFLAANARVGSRHIRAALMVLAGLVCTDLYWGGSVQAQGLAVAQDADVHYFAGNEVDGAIAVNPLNTNFMFIAGNVNANTGVFGLYSTNGCGTNWTTVTLTNLPQGLDPAVAWDAYGNLFLAYVNGVISNGTFSGVQVDYSTNGGMSFVTLTNLATGDTVLEPPRIAVGSGAALGSLWVTYKDQSLVASPVVAQGMQVTGLGAFGAFTGEENVSGTLANCGFPDIAVGPSNEVLVAFQTNVASPGLGAVYVNVNLAGLSSNGFGAPVLASANTIGGDTRIAAQPDYGINSAVSLAYNGDTNSAYYGRAYLVYVGQGTANPSDTDIFLRYSINDGKNWSGAVRVNDDFGTNSQFMPRISVDPGDGFVAVSWYDCRNDLGVIYTTNSVTTTNYTYVTGTGSTNSDGSTNINTNIVTSLVTTMNSAGSYDASPNDDPMVYAAISATGGASFLANQNLTSPNFTASGYEAKPAGSPVDFGDYTSLAFISNNFYAVWADNSGSAGANHDSSIKVTTTYTTNNFVAMYGSNADQLTISNTVKTNITTNILDGKFDLTIGGATVNGLADLSITSAVNTTNLLMLGSTPAYTITVSNAGPNAANNVSATVTFLPNSTQIFYASTATGSDQYNTNLLTWSVGTLAPNSSASLTAIVLLGPGAAVTNKTSVTGSGLDLVPTNNNFTLVTPVAYTADLALTLSGGPASLPPAALESYNLTVTNLGPLNASNVVVSNALPGNFTLSSISLPTGVTCQTNAGSLVFQIGNLTNGFSTSIGFTLQALAYGVGTDAAVVSSSTPDTNTANNSASVVTQVPTPPPPISNVAAVNVSVSSAFITWNTYAPSTAQVAYGLTPGYGKITSVNPALLTSHAVLLSGLIPNTNYFFEVISTSGGVISVSYGAFATIGPLILTTEQGSYSGTWTTAGAVSAYLGEFRFAQGTASAAPTASAVFSPTIPLSGNYDVSIWYPTNAGFSATTPMVITGGTNAVVTAVNQSTNGGGWVTLATGFYFAQGTSGNLAIYNNSGSTNNVAANAVQWTYSLAQDAASNGVPPAWWSGFYFGTNNVSGTADADGDGYSNYAEYVFGTDPTSAASHLQFWVAPASPTNTVVGFAPYVGGRLYQLFSATNLLDPVWLALTNAPSQDANGNGFFSVNNGGAAVYYQLSATPSP
jgi:uncharacterized repeat protein (TIGR01451 family)